VVAGTGDGAVVRQNFSQGPKRAVFGRVGVNTIIDSVQQEDSGEGDARVRVKRTYIKDPAESLAFKRYELPSHDLLPENHSVM
jgi:hypothetical protein